MATYVIGPDVALRLAHDEAVIPARTSMASCPMML